MTTEPAQRSRPLVSTLGVDGFLVSFGAQLSEPANRAALAYRAALETADIAGIAETATSLTSVYLRFDLAAADHARMCQTLDDLLDSRDWYAASLPEGRRRWRVPAVFGTDLAPQFEEAARLAGLSPAQAVAALCAAPLRVQTIGFAPGQPYLGELPAVWNIPRQSDLTPQVPQGALALAIRQMVLFSVSTPTGWRHVGQTAVRLFRPKAPDPFLLRPGDEVHFTAVSRDAFETLRAEDANGGAVAEVIG
ncbi:5-oxoprolinase subunit B family protein [Yoonia vestfoldensis]|uniref:5-oxoprolinase subunit B family protein n=1 Tax=Yoonia vestfoldensis TaxID=245188 RepID=UPI00047772DA|nr:carboxyltransferase domain-containing protein [Yoonia vestfoldensis]